MALEKILQFFNWAKGVYEGSKALQAIYTGFQVITAVVGVKGFLQARQMLAKGQDIMANKVAAGGKLPIIYGTRRVGAQIVYMDTANNSSQNLFVVYALSVGEVDEILLRTLEIDGNPLTDPNQFRNGGYLGSDKISSGAGSLCTANQTSGSVDLAGGTFGTNPAAGGYRYVFNAHHGEATQSADPMLRASIGSSWTTSHQLNGVAYIAASFIYDSKGQFSGVPQITVQVRGKKVYDQRKDSTNGGSGNQRIADVSTYEYSDNPAIIFQDFILNNEFGKGLTSSQLNLSTFTTAANKADALVNQPYYNGVAKTFVWSGTSGDNFIVVDPSGSGGLRWWQNKVGEAFYLTTSDSTLVLDGVQITAVERTHYPNQGVRLLIYFNDTLTSTYSNQTDGSALAKVRRFHCNGYVDGNKTVMENAKELLANMRGIFLYIDGKYELSIEDTGSSTFTITDDHIIEDQGISVDYGNKDKKANKVIIEYFNANKKYELDTATVLHNASPEYYSDDGEILEIKAEFPYVTDPYIAYNMGKAILTRSRNQTTMQFLGTPEMYKLNVGDIVTLTYTPLGFSGKVCRVEALELQSNGLVAVSLIEYFDVYTWEVPPQEDFEELSDIPSAYNVKKPTNITFTDTDASATNRPFLSWDLPTDYPYHQWRVNVVDSSSNQVLNKIVDINNVDLSFIPKANGYVASITALNSLGVESDAETKTFNVGDAPTATDDLQDGSVTNVKIDTLSAAKINTGELNLGQESGMAVRQTKTGYTSTATGFWLGNDGGTPKFNIGTSTNYLKFDGSDLDIAGEISATTGSIGGFTVGETSLTAGSGTSKISLSTADGIHLGANAFADAPFSVNLAGSLTAQSATLSGTIKSNQSFSSGSSTRTVKIDASSNALYTLTAGSDTPTEAPFRIKSDGTVEIFKLDLFLSDGVTKIFDADTGFTNNAFSEIAADLGTAISDYTVPLASNTEAQKITLTSTQNITVKAIKSAYMVGWSPNSSSYAKSRIPTNVRMRLMHSTNADLSSANELATLGSSWTAGVDRIDTGTPTANQYEIEEIVETETGFTFYEWVTLNQSGDAIDDNFDFTISSTASYAGSESGTDHYFFIEIDGTGGSTFGANSTTSTAARSLNISGVSFYISNGDASDTGEGDITAVNAGTNLTGGGTSGSVTLNLASTISGNHTFSNNLIVSGDLTVQGTTTTIDTANLNVEDNNITINYSSGDSSTSANGAGITIQDAVSAGNDATLTWNTSNDSFNFSHPVNVTGNIGVTGTVDGRDIATDGSKLDGIESGATTDQTQSEINALGITAIGLSGTPNITVGTINSGALSVNSGSANLAATFQSTDSIAGIKLQDSGGNVELSASGSTFRVQPSGGTPVFEINSSGNATFEGTISSRDISITGQSSGVEGGQINLLGVGSIEDIHVDNYDGTFRVFDGSAPQLRLSLDTSGNATFAGTISSGAITSSGNVTATAFYGDGSNLTGVTSTTINNNADNRIITGSGTANTLNAESGLTYDGSTLSGANIQMTGNINASGVTANNVSGNVLKIDSTTVVDNSRNLTNIGTISTSGQITQTVAGSNYFRSIASATGNAGLFMRNTARDWYILNNSVGTLELYDGTASAVRMSINTSGNTTFSGTISSGAISIANSTTAATLLTVGSSSQTNYSLQNFQTDTLSGNTAYLIAYGSGNAQDGNFAMKNTNTGGNIFFQVGTATPLTLTTTGSTFTGTISSGAITTSGNINTTSTSMGVTQSDGDYLAKLYQAGSDGKLELYTGQATPTSRIKLDSYYDNYINPAAGGLAIGKTTVGSGLELDVAGAIGISGTTVIDSSRNLTNIGTVSSTHFSTSANISGTGDGGLFIGNGKRLGFDQSGTRSWTIKATSGYLSVFSGDGAGDFNVGGNNMGLRIGGTLVLTSARNLTNIGTISSGVITATALISDAGNNYSQVKLSGDNGTNGDSYRFTLNNDNTLLLQRSTDNFAANATLALTIDSSQNATFAGNVGIGISPSNTFSVGASGTVTTRYTSTDTSAFSLLMFENSGSIVFSADHGNSAANSDIVFQNDGAQERLRIDASGNIKHGASQTTIIDASRNLTNIGTINSGAITVDDITINGSTISDAGDLTFDVGGDITFDAGGGDILFKDDGTLVGTIGGFASNNMIIKSEYSDGDVIIQGNDGGSGITALTLDMSNGGRANFNNDIGLNDDRGVRFGSDDDSVIYNDGSNFYIKNGTNNHDIIFQGNDDGSPITALTLDMSNAGNATFAGNIIGNDIKAAGSGGLSFQTDEGTKRIEITDGGTVDIKNATLRIGTTTVIDTSRNLTNIGTITQTTNGEILDASANLTNINNIYASGYRIGSTTVIDSSRNLTNIGTVNCSTISNSSTLLIDAGNEIHLDADSGIIRVRDDGGDIGMFRNESLDFTIRSMVGGKDIIFKGNNGSSVIEAMRIDMSAGGSVIATGNVTAYSDKRLKEKIETLDSKKALQMRGVSFIKDGVKGSGVIAQEIEEIAPELVLTADDEIGTKSVAYGNLVGYLIETVKDQQKQIDELKQRLDNDS